MDVVTFGETMALLTSQTTGLMRYANQFSYSFAGAESNTAIGLARLGHQVGWISQVGEDEFGESILQLLHSEGVDISKVKKDSNHQTGLMVKEPINKREMRIYYYRNNSAASHMNHSNLNEDYLANAKYLYLTGITPALSSNCYEMVMDAIRIAKKHRIPIVFDPNYRSKLWDKAKAKQVLLEIIAKIDILLPGIEEGNLLVGETKPEELANRFLALGVSVVIMKLGAKGAYYATNDSSEYVEGFPVEQVIDPVGAGDAFAAGFLSGQLDGLSLLASTQRACAVAGLVVEVQGDYAGFPLRETLNRLMDPSNQDVLR